MTDEAIPDPRVAALEQRLAEMQEAHRTALLGVALRTEALRAGMIDLDGLKLVDSSGLTLDDNGEGYRAHEYHETRKTVAVRRWIRFVLECCDRAAGAAAAAATRHRYDP